MIKDAQIAGDGKILSMLDKGSVYKIYIMGQKRQQMRSQMLKWTVYCMEKETLGRRMPRTQ
jgi:hypothetical protein